jgi:hypothetical protein
MPHEQPDGLPSEDYQKPFFRVRRTLRHLWHINRGDKKYNPNGCDGCREIHHFLSDPRYLGDEHYPVGVEADPDPGEHLGPNWKLGPDEMETTPPREPTTS